MSAGVTIYGVGAVSLTMLIDALESNGRTLILLCALGCTLSSAYGLLSRAGPFGAVEGTWTFVAIRRWRSAP